MKRTLLLLVLTALLHTSYGQGGPRWYHFTGDLFDAYQSALSKYVGSTEAVLWPDTSAIIGYTTTAGTPLYKYGNLPSAGLGFNPTYMSPVVYEYGWNSCSSSAVRDYTGEVAITPADAYTIDSVYVGGWYRRNSSKPLVVDTLIFTLIKSPRTGSSIDLAMVPLTPFGACFTVASLPYRELWRDLANARAAHNGGTSTINVYKFPLTNTDTNYNPGKNAVYPRATHPTDPAISFAVGANEVVAMSVSFKTGDVTYPVFPGQDTIRTTNGISILSYKYGTYSLQVNYATSSSASGSPAECPFYDSTGDGVSGYFAFEGSGYPWHNAKYYPTWSHIGSSSSIVPGMMQFPNIGYHTQCSTCHLVTCIPAFDKVLTEIKNVAVVPNPANGVLNISLPEGNTAATAVLTNMLGRVVAKQSVTRGKAEFNTANLPAGIYMYTIQSGNEMASGRVAIVH